jgi:hypothetical protein
MKYIENGNPTQKDNPPLTSTITLVNDNGACFETGKVFKEYELIDHS